MVRMRCRIGEDEEPASARAKLAATLEEHSARPGGAGVRRAAAGAAARARGGRDRRPPGPVRARGGCSSSAWRTRIPVVLAFEDVQWADTSLLDFIEYLLEWSRNHPLFVITLAPAGAARAPAGLGRRPAQLHVALPRAARPERRWTSCSRGSCPGCRSVCATQILARAQGVPLYAVETVRMLLDRGLLSQDGSVYTPTRRDRDARGPGDAARADRRPPGRRLGRRSGGCCRTGRCSARRSRLQALAALSGDARAGARAAAGRAGAQGGARPAVRPALARARPVRLPAGPRPPRRLRDAGQARAQEPPPRRRRAPRRRRSPTRTRSPRCSPPTTWPPPRPAPRPTTRRRSGRRRARCSPVPASAPARSARPTRHSATTSRPPRSPTDPLARGGAARAGRPAGDRWRTGRARRASGSSARSRCTPPRASRQAAARASAALADVDVDRGAAGGRRRPGSSRRSPSSSRATPRSELAAALAELGRMRALVGPRRAGQRAARAGAHPGRAAAAARGVRRGAHQQGDRRAATRGGWPRRGSCSRPRPRERTRSSCTRASCVPRTTSLCVLEASDRYGEAIELVERSARARPPPRRPPLGVATAHRRAPRAVPARPLGRGAGDRAEEEPLVAIEGARGAARAALIHSERGELGAAEAMLADRTALATATTRSRAQATPPSRRGCCAPKGARRGAGGGRAGARARASWRSPTR